MELLTIELQNNKAYKLISDLADLNIIKIINPKEKKIAKSKNDLSKYIGMMSKEQAKSFDNHVKQSREEWDRSL